jgi:hypothetical protein
MIAAAAKFLPAAAKFLRQIVPPVIATLIAAVLIQGYNRTFSSHLTQPRLGGLTEPASAAPEPAATTAAASVVGMTKAPAAPVTEYITIYERAEPERLADKDEGREAGKEQAAITVAPARAAAPAPGAKPARAPAIAAAPVTVPVTTSIAVAPVASEPPPVIVAPPPQTYALAPQGPHDPAISDDAPPPPRRGALGAIANALSPSALFSRAREFGEKIEATGNEILPNIRP